MRTLLAMFAFLFCAATAPAQSVDDLVKKLGSRNYPEREKAAKALEQIGASAIPTLRAGLAKADLETYRRAVLVIEHIEERILIDQIVKATPIRLQFRDVAVRDALVNVQQQMGLRIGNTARTNRIGKLDTGVVPYWQAWRDFRDAALLEEVDYAQSAAKLKRISATEQERVPLIYGDAKRNTPPFSVPPLTFASTATAPWAEDVRHSVRVRARWLRIDPFIEGKAHAVFALEVRPEPRLEIVMLPRVEITKIVDSDGVEKAVSTVPMLATEPTPEVERFLLAYAGEIQFGGLLHLKALPWDGKERSIKEVHGHVRIEVKAYPRLIEIANALKSVGKEERGLDGVTLKVLETDTSDEGDLVLRLHLHHLDSFTPKTPEEAIVRVRPGFVAQRGAIDVAMERLRLVDRLGSAYKLVKLSYDGSEAKGYSVELHFAAKAVDGDVPTLILSKAPRVLSLEIPFVVRELAVGK